jgi:predicted  nucleic acid-binding Zn-ribbon protein
MKMTAETLTRAATLAGQIEALETELTTVTNKANELSKQISPLQTELSKLVGSTSVSRKACKRGVKKTSRRFTPEQRAAISAGLRAKWAERKAAKAATTPPVGA